MNVCSDNQGRADEIIRYELTTQRLVEALRKAFPHIRAGGNGTVFEGGKNGIAWIVTQCVL